MSGLLWLSPKEAQTIVIVSVKFGAKFLQSLTKINYAALKFANYWFSLWPISNHPIKQQYLASLISFPELGSNIGRFASPITWLCQIDPAYLSHRQFHNDKQAQSDGRFSLVFLFRVMQTNMTTGSSVSQYTEQARCITLYLNINGVYMYRPIFQT